MTTGSLSLALSNDHPLSVSLHSLPLQSSSSKLSALPFYACRSFLRALPISTPPLVCSSLRCWAFYLIIPVLSWSVLLCRWLRRAKLTCNIASLSSILFCCFTIKMLLSEFCSWGSLICISLCNLWGCVRCACERCFAVCCCCGRSPACPPGLLMCSFSIFNRARALSSQLQCTNRSPLRCLTPNKPYHCFPHLARHLRWHWAA